MADRYAGKAPRGTEYGGKDGLIQKAEDGHVELTAAEKAQIMRTHGVQGDLSGLETDLNVAVGFDADGTAWEDVAHRDKALRRAAADQRLNGRQIGEAL